MQPDLLLKRNGRVVSVIDTKWKRVEDTDKMARADLYQMATYATFFLQGVQGGQAEGQLSLVYPSVGAHEPKRFEFAPPMNRTQLAMHWFHLPLCEDGSLQPTLEGLSLPQLFGLGIQ